MSFGPHTVEQDNFKSFPQQGYSVYLQASTPSTLADGYLNLSIICHYDFGLYETTLRHSMAWMPEVSVNIQPNLIEIYSAQQPTPKFSIAVSDEQRNCA